MIRVLCRNSGKERSVRLEPRVVQRGVYILYASLKVPSIETDMGGS